MSQEKLFITAHGPSVVRHEGKILVNTGKMATDLGIYGHIHPTREAAEADTGIRDAQVFEVEANFPDGAVFEVTQNSDMTEGRGPMVRVGLFSSFVVALRIAKGRGVYGSGDGDVNLMPTDPPVVFDTVDEFHNGSAKPTTPGQHKVTLMGYSGLNTDYFAMLDPFSSDPDYAKYLELKAKFGR